MGSDQFPKHIFDELVKLNHRFESLSNDVHELSEQFTKLDRIITGNGNPSQGLIVQVDRLSQESARRSIWTRAAIGASVSSFVGFIWMLLKTVK